MNNILASVGLIFLFVSTIALVYPESHSQQSDNYGPYKLIFYEFKSCKGPKAKDDATLHAFLDNATGIGLVNLTFHTDSRFEELRIQVFNLKGNKSTFLWNYRLHEPCKHFSFAVVIQQTLNATNCYIKKGTYANAINLNEITNEFLGKSFYYETIMYKAIMTSKKGNIGCFRCVETFQKK